MHKVSERKHLDKNSVPNGVYSYWFYCSGCKCSHPFTVGPQLPNYGKARWQFNGDFEKPTFTPSLLCNPDHAPSRCHLFLTDGKIIYLSDCFHELAGKTIDCPDISQLPEYLRK
jgi:hypothetical protein